MAKNANDTFPISLQQMPADLIHQQPPLNGKACPMTLHPTKQAVASLASERPQRLNRSDGTRLLTSFFQL